jgi:hypothetical protein
MSKAERPKLRELLEYIYPGENSIRWNISFGGDSGIDICRGEHEKGDDCEWEHVSLGKLERAEADIVARDHPGVHMSHCFQGEYEGSCKYGDDDCPAGVGYVDPLTMPVLGGGLTPVEWLRSMAVADRKRKANARADEADKIADWIQAMVDDQ